MRAFVFVFSACVSLTACGNEYHPEYHPVSVSEVSQNLAYPVVVHNGGAASERGPVFVTQPPGPVLAMPPAPPQPAPPLPPAEWFRGY